MFTWIKANYQFAHLAHRLSFKFARTSVSKKRIPRRARCAAVTVSEETPTEQPGQPRNVSIPNRETILIYQPLAAPFSSSLLFSLFLSLTFSALILFRLVRMLPVPLPSPSPLLLPFYPSPCSSPLARGYRGWIAIRCNGFVSFNRPTVERFPLRPCEPFALAARLKPGFITDYWKN